MAVKYLMGSSPIVIIKDHFELRYVQNYGAAFGILQQKRIFFIIITTIVILLIILYLYKNYNVLSNFAKFSITLFLSGAIGNFIDRLRLGYVIDFLRVNLIKSYDFPVFNMADVFIVVGTALIVFVVLFDKYEVRGK
jgi:signal peptidase II